MSPPQLLATGLSLVILVGTLLLVTPLAGVDGVSIGWSAALFTATSAVCVTGLIVVDTPTAFSAFGQAVILVLIQIGGLGYMTLATFISMMIGRRISMDDQASLQESLNLDSRRDVARFALSVVKVTLVFEAAGALILAARWWPEFGAADAAWLGLFHSVSAFNNAGFSLFSNNLMNWRGDLVINLTIMALIIAGGIGYLVLADLARWRSQRRLSMHSRFVIRVSAALIAVGAAGLYLVERGNPLTLGAITRSEATLAAVFQSVTARTAGFNSIDMAALSPPSYLFLLVLMFIGGGPGGTAGGIKVSTFGVTVMALWATIRGMREPHVLKRRIPGDVVARAFFISLIAFLSMNLVAGALLVMEGTALLATLFESASAFGTVGLSTGVPGTPLSLSASFSEPGRLLICLLMFAGRIGPLTLAFALAARQTAPRVRYPEGRVLIG
jgi:trk system potassium uptake protein TrkH